MLTKFGLHQIEVSVLNIASQICSERMIQVIALGKNLPRLAHHYNNVCHLVLLLNIKSLILNLDSTSRR